MFDEKRPLQANCRLAYFSKLYTGFVMKLLFAHRLRRQEPHLIP